MSKLIGYFLLFFVVFPACADGQHQKIGNGFTFYKKDFDVGSKGVLIIEKTVPARMLNPGVARFKFGVDLQNADSNIEALSKFIELVGQANKKGETLTQPISTVRAFGFGVYDYWNQYEVVTQTDQSGQLSLVLRITPITKVLFKTVPTAVDPGNAHEQAVSIDYSEQDAKSLIDLLTVYKNGKIDESIERAASEPGLLDKVGTFIKGKTTAEDVKRLLGEPSQEMETPDFNRMDYGELKGNGKNVMVVLVFDKQGRYKDKMISKW